MRGSSVFAERPRQRSFHTGQTESKLAERLRHKCYFFVTNTAYSLLLTFCVASSAGWKSTAAASGRGRTGAVQHSFRQTRLQKVPFTGTPGHDVVDLERHADAQKEW